MKASHSTVILSILIAVAGAFWACGRQGPLGPTSPSPPGGAPGLTRIEIIGPAVVAPGQTAQFSVTGYFTDGSTRDVTSAAHWINTKSWILSVTSSGLLTALQLGEDQLSAVVPRPGLGAVSSVHEVLALYPGTYRLAGVVRARGIPQSGAQIEVLGGTASGYRATTGLDGWYRLFGVSGSILIRVTKVGYQSYGAVLLLADPRNWRRIAACSSIDSPHRFAFSR